MIVDQKPKFCVQCGDRLKPWVTTWFDPQTGKKAKTVDEKTLFCPNGYCYAHNVYLLPDGRWSIG